MHIDKRLLRLTLSVKTYLILTIIFGLIAASATIGQAFFLSDIINKVFINGFSLSEVVYVLLLVTVLSLLKALFIWNEQNYANKVAAYIKNKIRENISNHIFNLGPSYTKSERTGEIVNTLTNGVEKLDAYFSQFLPQLFLSALIPILILVFVFPIDLLTAVVFLVTAPLIPVFMILIGSMAERLNKKQWKSLSLMSAYFLDVIQGLTTIKLFGKTEHVQNKISVVSTLFKNSTMKVLRIAFLSALVLEVLSTISIAIVAVEIGLRLMYGNMEFQPALFILILAPEFYNPFRQLGARYHAGMEGVAAAQSLYKILETPLSVFSNKSNYSNFTFSKSIEFNDVHFTYDGGEKEAVNGISFQIIPGSITALVGESGSGKTTTINLILKFLEPSKGSINIDDKPLIKIEREKWLEQIGWISQNPYLFHTTIKENLLIAKENATVKEIHEAVKLAKLDKFISSLPDGLDTIIGEKGARISGGEVQRVALARAFLKNAPFLIMDEPTANLDLHTESELMESLNLLAKNKTVLIIAHRLNTIKQADNILVFSNGNIVEQGNHDFLSSYNGVYKKLLNKFKGET